MKRILIIGSVLSTFLYSSAKIKDSLIAYPLPDSVKAISFMVEFSVGAVNTKKEVFAGIKTDVVKLSLESERNEREIVFEFPSQATIVANGLDVKIEKGELSWKHTWAETEQYKLLIATASDSAENFALYSGYIFLPNEKKWKLIGTCKITGQWNTLKQPAVFYSIVKKSPLQININQAWCQRNNGSWRNLLQQTQPLPLVNLLSHVDSLEQSRIDKEIIVQNKLDAKQERQDVYYTMLKDGTGRQVAVTDTVTVFYKGYLLKDGSVFDETKDKPATFPLRRLIMGWQNAVPLCKVGGKIRIIIPSGLAYSIRTRAAKIPPNSILVFEVEVVDAKPVQ